MVPNDYILYLHLITLSTRLKVFTDTEFNPVLVQNWTLKLQRLLNTERPKKNDFFIFFKINTFYCSMKMVDTMKQQASKIAKKDCLTRLAPGIYQFDNCDEYHRTCQIRNRAFLNMPQKGRPKNSSKALEYLTKI
ncbi:hypothetical protein BpHYR1_009333 [Brachionus plicatilis]|uniref:Uncharacterized protein n=1 Tax=Brachionus plicatilis TaxID=10195 RepID=A0A3M7QJL9_BRAPC|nr:hypothetical protein BpHYR1_009333 [Brachionus plicatilis]